MTQEIDLQSGHTLDAAELEGGYDKLTYLLQEIKEQVARCIKYAVAQTDIATAEKFLSDIITASEAAQTSATSAASSATRASNKASEASTSQVLAAGYATDASNYAASASESAAAALASKNAANTAAFNAEQAATAAESAKEDAEAAKDVVDGYKDDAAGYASEASISADNAATSATAANDAKASALAAKGAAETAQGKAETAESNAQTAAETAQAAAAELAAHNTDTTAHADMRTLIAGKQEKLPDGAAGLYLKKTENGVTWGQPSGGGGGGGSVDWGSIGGTLADQTDLMNILNNKQAAGNYAAASHTHNKTDITGMPTKLSDLINDSDFITAADLPTKVSELENDSGFLTSVSWGDIDDKPSTFTPSSHTHTKNQVTDMPTKLSDFTDDLGTNPTHTHSQYLTSVPVASTTVAGKVKPDGTTITSAADGTISAVGGGGSITATYDSANKILTLE